MKLRIRNMWLHLFALLFVVSIAHAQQGEPAQSNFSQPELEQMLAPIALYPDALLSQILMASTYPTEVVEASYWIKANPGLKGEAAVNAAQDQQWDISVKSLLPFPQVLGTMETKIDWTQNLGNAFLGQEQQVMDTVQSLRRKARAAGYLKSDNRIRVAEQDQLISISLATPTAIYVPYYNPTVVYGAWSEPAYAPVYWEPWQGYAVAPGYYGWAWSPVATIVTVGVLYAAFDWRHRHVYYDRHVNYWQRHYHYDHYRSRGTGPALWNHDARHRRDIPYRQATVNQRFGNTARTYNTRVGPRPALNDIRSGHYKPPVVSATGRTRTARTSNPYAGFKPGPTAATTGRTAPGTVGTTGQPVHGGRTVPGTVGTTGKPVSATVGTTGKPGPSATGVAGKPVHGGRSVPGTVGTTGKPVPGTVGTTGKPSTTGVTGKPGTVGAAGVPGTKSVSNRGSNPPGMARGVRGTQPSASSTIRNTTPGATTGTRPGNVGKPSNANVGKPINPNVGKPANANVRANTNANVRSNTGAGKPAGVTPRAVTPKPAVATPKPVAPRPAASVDRKHSSDK